MSYCSILLSPHLLALITSVHSLRAVTAHRLSSHTAPLVQRKHCRCAAPADSACGPRQRRVCHLCAREEVPPVVPAVGGEGRLGGKRAGQGDGERAGAQAVRQHARAEHWHGALAGAPECMRGVATAAHGCQTSELQRFCWVISCRAPLPLAVLNSNLRQELCVCMVRFSMSACPSAPIVFASQGVDYM